jgi:cobalt-precorrin-5B (C1)-methyltransferase
MVLRQHLIHQVSIVTPSGVTLCLNVESPHIEGQQAIAAIRKDGDDVDATHGMLIFARVTLDDSGEIALQGGEGVGTVTRKGIGLPVGSSAINRTPRQTIESAVREAIGPNRGAQIEIFAPEGEERAQNLQLPPWHSGRHFDYRHHGYCHADVGRELETFAVAGAGN